MLSVEKLPALPDLDQQIYEMVVPQNHYLRQVAERVDFERFRPRLAEAYSQRMGRPAIDPVRMLKILFLCFHYNLSDRLVMERSKTDVAFRWFLGLRLVEKVPNHTEGTYFRQRIGEERFKMVFQELVTQAREAGLVKDRLRSKDATHLLANVADLRPLQLAAQLREHLLETASPYFADWVSEQRARIETLRQTTAELPDSERLAARVEQLRQMAEQLRESMAQLPPAQEGDRRRQRLNRILNLVDKLLADRADPEAGDRLVSGMDPDARAGKHGDFYTGYLLDMAIDPDSELITAINVLPANGAEAADAISLIQQEEQAQGNDVQGLSMDGIGYNGPILRELTDPAGLNLEVTVPPPQAAKRTTFGPDRFSLKIIDEHTAEVTCPNSETTQQRRRNGQGTGNRYQFRSKQCAGCRLRCECLENPDSPRGRVVDKNDYEAEYQKVAAKAKTPEYQETRRAHRKIERKLGEVARHHKARRARYWGRAKVFIQAALTALVVNVKRFVKLMAQKTIESATTLPLRAELAQT